MARSALRPMEDGAAALNAMGAVAVAGRRLQRRQLEPLALDDVLTPPMTW